MVRSHNRKEERVKLWIGIIKKLLFIITLLFSFNTIA
jgi:hypothetical protein